MKILRINGGLGNQLFQYIFYRILEISTNDICIFDDRAFFYNNQHNGYEIDKIFKIKPNLLSNYFDSDVWNELLEITREDVDIVTYLKEAGIANLKLVTEGEYYFKLYENAKIKFNDKYTTIQMNSYAPQIINLSGNLYYEGYWINAGWFQYIKDIIIKDLTFPVIEDDYNKKMIDMILNSNSIGVHIRRGDFITLGWDLDATWYQKSVGQMKLLERNPVFFIFSDDLNWCKDNMEALGFTSNDKIFFMDGNTGENNFRDMQLMTYCKNLIIANSSFSYLAALLNQTPNKFVLNPTARRII